MALLNIQKIKIMTSSRITSWQIDGDTIEIMTDFIFFDSKLTVNSDCNHEIKILAPWKEGYDKTTQHIKKQRHHSVDKGLYSKSSGFSSICVWM